MSKPEQLSQDLSEADELRVYAIKLLDHANSQAAELAAELAAKDAEIASWRVQLDAANDMLVRRGEEIARLTEQVAIFGGVVGRLECERNELRAALRPFANAGKHCEDKSAKFGTFVCEGDWVRAVEVMGG